MPKSSIYKDTCSYHHKFSLIIMPQSDVVTWFLCLLSSFNVSPQILVFDNHIHHTAGVERELLQLEAVGLTELYLIQYHFTNLTVIFIL